MYFSHLRDHKALFHTNFNLPELKSVGGCFSWSNAKLRVFSWPTVNNAYCWHSTKLPASFRKQEYISQVPTPVLFRLCLSQELPENVCAQPSMSTCAMWRLNNNWSISEYLTLKPQRITDRCLVYLQCIKLLSVFWPLCLTYPNLNPSLRTSGRPLGTRSGFTIWFQACTIMGTTWFKPRLLSLFHPLSNSCLGYLWHFCSLYNFSSESPSPAASTEDMLAGFSCGHPSQQTSLPNLTAL